MLVPRPTDVELRILDVFWDTGHSTVRQAKKEELP